MVAIAVVPVTWNMGKPVGAIVVADAMAVPIALYSIPAWVMPSVQVPGNPDWLTARHTPLLVPPKDYSIAQRDRVTARCRRSDRSDMCLVLSRTETAVVTWSSGHRCSEIPAHQSGRQTLNDAAERQS
jgi:hypothetical protein